MMKKGITICALFLISLTLQAQEYRSFEHKIDSMFDFYSGYLPGAVVTVNKDGKQIFNKAYGTSKTNEGIMLTTESLFNISSLSKIITATAIMRLMDKKKISYDDKITKYIKGLPAYANDVSIRNLLQHTSGLPEYPISEVANNEEVLEFLREQNTLLYIPGEKWQYSNCDYPVLASIIEAITDKSYEKYVNKYIFKKLKLSPATFSVKGIDSSYLSNGHFFNGKRFVEVNENAINNVLGEQNLFLSNSEYSKLLYGIFEGKIVAKDKLDDMFTPIKLNDESVVDYGIAWVLMKRNDFKYYWHGGNYNGYNNLVLFLPDYNIIISIFANRNNANNFLRNAMTIAGYYCDMEFIEEFKPEIKKSK